MSVKPDGADINYDGKIINVDKKPEYEGKLIVKTTNLGSLLEGIDIDSQNIPNKNGALNCEGELLLTGDKFDYTQADAIVKYITFKPEEHQDKSVKLDSCIFVITGKLQNFKNRQELVDKIEASGGKVSSSVSSKTNYLINNDVNSTSSKNKKAKELGIPIITENELMEMLS
jgi:NAD-dependent DNA ligase